MNPQPMIPGCLMCVAAFTLAGCGAGGGGDDGGSLDQAVGHANASYLVINLDDGRQEPRTAIADLATNPAYRDRLLVLRRIEVVGRPQFLAVFETTQAQWRRIAAQQPWSAVPAEIVGAEAIGDDRPAFALAGREVLTALDAYAARTALRLSLPTAEAWDAACGSGQERWTWGGAHDQATLNAFAVVRENRGEALGPLPVGGRQANALGFFDLHGNVWELVAPGDRAVGGSWYDPVHAGRTGARLDRDHGSLTDLVRCALVGVRLAVIP